MHLTYRDAIPSSSADIANVKAEVEVTPEMVEAGNAALAEYINPYVWDVRAERDAVRAIFAAMYRARATT